MLPASMREHQNHLFPPEEPFCDHHCTGEWESKTKACMVEQNSCCLSTAHITVWTAEVTPAFHGHTEESSAGGGCGKSNTSEVQQDAVIRGRAVPGGRQYSRKAKGQNLLLDFNATEWEAHRPPGLGQF